MTIDRRHFVLGAGVAGMSALGFEVFAEQLKDISELKPGDFTWHPDRQPTGPVAVVVSIPEQLVHVYRNGVRIAVSTCSTGKPGHSTPTGVFVVLQKDKHHRSSTYNNAPMPNMNRLTWSGIALHAGNLPGYPASHGCVRLPLAFSENLFEVTHLGTPVIISGKSTDPWELKHPGMVLSGYAEHEFENVEAALEDKKHPKDWIESETAPITSVIASSRERRIMLLENGNVLMEGELSIDGSRAIGNHVFVLRGPDSGARGLHWQAISHQPGDGPVSAEETAITRLRTSDEFVARMRKRMHPGLVMILTEAPLHPDTRSGQDFVIMS
ncbi:L,D-transpeptidase [Microbaculum sp. FT89]|uniref:L,D-transpeptidase n=1 Tax=Microbaculum sp. FT89 TaxID=3447298 RepID=UPI003F53CD84